MSHEGTTWKRWSPEDDSRLADRYRKGWPLARIAASLARTERAVSKRLDTMSDSPRRQNRRGGAVFWSAADELALRELHAAGDTHTVIAAKLNRTKGSIRKRLRKIFPRKLAASATAVVTAPKPPVVAWTPPDDRMDLVRLWQAANRRLGSSPAGGAVRSGG